MIIKKKRILHIYKSYFPDSVGGIQEAIKNIISATRGEDLEHTILTLSNNFKEEYLDGVRIIRFPETISISSCPISLSLLFNYRKIVKSFDLLHYHSPWPFAESLHVLLAIKKPYVVTYQSDIVKQYILKRFYWPFFKRFMSGASRIAVATQSYLATSLDLKPYMQKCVVIPLGIPDLPTPDLMRVEYWKERVGEGFLLFIGVLRYYKGLNVLLEALKGREIPMVIIGEGPCEAELKTQALQNGLHSTHFIGKVSEIDKVALLSLSRGLVLPSNHRSEAYGIALVEGLAASKPLISTELGSGTSFINKAGETGWVVEINSPEALGNAIDSLFLDNFLAQRFSKAARCRYKEYFTCEVMGKAYCSFYNQII